MLADCRNAGILPSTSTCQNRYGRLATRCQRAVAEPQTKEPPSKRGHAKTILLHSGKTIVCLAQRQRGHAESILCHSAICHARATPPLRTAFAATFLPVKLFGSEKASEFEYFAPLAPFKTYQQGKTNINRTHTHAKRTVSQFVFGRSQVYAAS